MLSKNNQKEKLRKLEEKNNHFSIRKLSVGAASVLIGLTFMGVSNNKVDAATNDPAQVATVETAQKDEVTQQAPQSEDAQAANKSQVANTTSNEAVENAPAVKGVGDESNGEKINNIQSTISVTATNKNTDQTSTSSAGTVQVNEPVASDLSGVITLTNNTDQEQQISSSYPENSYGLAAWYGTNAQIVVDPSRVKIDNGQVVFGGNYTDSNVSIISWDVANSANSSTGFSNSQENKDAIAKNPELIGGFQIGGSLKPHETVNIIVPLKAVDTQKDASGYIERQWGQRVNIQESPENFRNASDYTDSSLSVDGLTDGNISNLDASDGELTLVGQITNNGLISHDENLIFNLSDANNTDIHKVQTVLDHSKAIQLNWANASDNDISYYVDGSYKTADQMTESDWDHVTQVKVNATLQSGQTGKVTIPVKLSNVDQIKSDLQSGDNAGSSQNRLNQITLSAKSDNADVNVTNGTVQYYSEIPETGVMSAIDDAITGKDPILPTYLGFDKDGKPFYVLIQGITMPKMSKDDFTYLNIGHQDPSDTLFSDGIYAIKLDKIFDAVKDQGYSVNISNNDGAESTWQSYYYHGNANKKPELYVQLQQIFNTKNLSLMVGDSWNSNDSLESAKVDFNLLNFSANLGTTYQGSKDLKATGDYTYDLYDENGNQIAKDVPVGQNVPTLAMGTYKVVYHYQINKNEAVSKTATIVVNDSTSGEPLIQPELPEAPLPQEPDTPSTPSDNNDNPGQPTDDNDNNVAPHAGETPNKDNHKGQASKSNDQTSEVHATSEVKSESNGTVQAATIDHNGQGNGNNAQGQNGEKTLPQTGEENTNAGLFGLMIASLGALFGLAGYRKRKN